MVSGRLVIDMRILPLSLFAAVMPLATACDTAWFAVEIDVPEVCVHGLQAPFGGSQASATFENTLSDHDLGIVGEDKLSPKVEVLSISLAPSLGVDDLGFVDNLAVEMAPEDEMATLPPVELLNVSASDMLDSGELYSEPEDAIDITTYIKEGAVVFSVELTGDVPPTPWVATMDLCLHAQAAYEETF
jgi:hypothetical protein